jgi:biopolymer transport protein TolR
MGMSSGSGGGTSKHVSSEINVTPLIDVLLVLLIIFLVVMPIMMKMETLQVPRKIDDQNEMPDPNASQLTIKVKADMTYHFNDGSSEQDTPIQATDIAKLLRPKLEAMATGNEKVVFVHFEDAVPWDTVVTTMDTVRSIASDVNHDEIKVALKVKEDKEAAASP